MNDGAAGLILVSEEALDDLGLESLGRYVAGGSAGVHPDVMGIGPVPATRKVLARAGWDIGDVQEAEFNEAFAAQALACVDQLGVDPERVNADGGAIALGHPLGCSGARILTTLLHRMRRTGAERGSPPCAWAWDRAARCWSNATDGRPPRHRPGRSPGGTCLTGGRCLHVASVAA
ncbi:hypothetical protein ACFQV4_22255 [Streptomyces thermocarboxydus]